MATILNYGPALAQVGEDPCPLPKTALRQTPTDLAAVQADIDRYTLCLERARLIKRLNDLATENDAMLAGFSSGNPGMTLNETLLSEPPQEAEQSEPEKVWEILEIFGPVNELEARLMRDSAIIQVRAGELLPDGNSVDEITPTEVIISGNAGRSVLGWSQ